MGILSSISDFFHPEKKYQEAEKQNQQGWEQAQGFQKPFWQQGLDQYQNLFGAENKLLNPAALQDEWSKGYQTSPYAKQLLEQNKTSGLDAASSMGLMGSSAALGNIQQGAGNIVNQDRQQYLNDLMQKYMSGIGIGQGIYGIGAQTGANLGQGAQRYGENQAGLKYGEKQAQNGMIGKILGTISGGLLGPDGFFHSSPKTGGAPVSDISQWAS